MLRIIITLVATLLLAYVMIVHAKGEDTPEATPELAPATIIEKIEPKTFEHANRLEMAVPGVEHIRQAIIKYADQHGVSSSWLLRVAQCESGYNPGAVNYGYYAGGGHPSGLFQYLPETWNRIGSCSPYGVGDIWNYDHQARLTAWAFANGYSGEWQCQ